MEEILILFSTQKPNKTWQGKCFIIEVLVWSYTLLCKDGEDEACICRDSEALKV